VQNMEKKALTEEAKEKRRAYYRKWREKNPGKAAEYMARYWEKKARESEGQDGEGER